MFKLNKRFLSRLLILLLVLGPAQASIASNVSQNSNCKMLQMQSIGTSDIQSGALCDQEHNDQCFNIQNCPTSHHSTSIQSRTSFHEPIRIVINLHTRENNNNLFTFYPDPLKRPPIA
jgi:hypothetical protein